MKKIGAEKFYLLGYEMGVQMALDMASIFEDNGKKSRYLCGSLLIWDLQVIYTVDLKRKHFYLCVCVRVYFL